METVFGKIDAQGNVTETIKLDINKLPSSDPLAFAYGISSGIQHKQQVIDNQSHRNKSFKEIHGSNYRKLAQEYLRGFLLGYNGILVKEGTKIKKGHERTLLHHKDNILKP